MADTSLESLEPLDYAWGGDGSDPFEPIRAHVLAALIPTDQPYLAPLDRLLTLGSAFDDAADPAFEQIQFLPEHADDLVRMARDRALHTALNDTAEVWAPIWAVRALGRIGASDRIVDLVPLLDLDEDGIAEFLAEAFEPFGEIAIAPLAAHLYDHSRWMYSRAHAIEILDTLAAAYPECRDQIVQIYTTALRDATTNPASLNGFLLSGLISLQATEALPVIRRAFEEEAIDLSIAGDWPDVLKYMHQPIDERDALVQAANQRNRLRSEQGVSGSPALRQQQRTRTNQSSNQKNKANQRKRKRKAATSARKTNKKRR